MKNDRGRRGGKAGAKTGRAEGRGRGSGSSQQGGATGSRGHNTNPANGGEGAGRAGGTGSARGGRGQPRNGGRGSGGVKRSAGSIEAAARVAPNAPLSAGATKAQKRAGSRANKKVKTGEAASNVLWNSASKGKGTGDNGGVTSSGRISSSSSGDTQDLSALAKKFKERFGEEVASDGEEDETTQSSNNVFETPGRKRFSGGAGPKSPAEEAAQSMSPAKLAAEVQKARARAREERFGGGGGGSSRLVTKPSSFARSGRSVPIGQPAATAPPRGTPPPARVSRIPLDHAATGQQQQQGSHKKKKVTELEAASASSPQQEAAAAAAAAAGKDVLPAAGAPKAHPLGEIVSTEDAVSASTKPRAVSPVTTACGAPARFSAPLKSTASYSSAAASSVVVRPDPEQGGAKSTPGKTGRWSPAVVKTATTGEAIPVDESPPPTAASGAAPKRPAPNGGDGVVVEPPAKKMLAASKPPASPLSPQSLPPPSQPQAAGATGGKIHTLRLRLRADLVADPKQPAQIAHPAIAGSAGAGGSSGVEECKGFEPPNPAPDAGVEECKGFDPPNLPLTTTSQHQQNAAPAPSPSVSNEVASAPPGASTIASPDAVSRLSVAGDGGTPTSSTFAREGSWGPSFGIAGAGEERGISTPLVPATPAPSPDVSVSKAPNPWILSAENPTFARNQGRPLAQSFPQPTTPTGGDGNGENKRGSAGRAAGERVPAVAVVPSVAASGRGAGVRRGFGEPGGGRTPTTSNAPTVSSPLRTSSPTPGIGGARGSNVTDRVVERQARLLSTTSVGSNPQPLSVTEQGAAAGGAVAAAATAEGGAGAATAAVAESAVTGVAGVAGAAAGGQVVLGVHMSGRAGQLLDRLKREREESLDFERKLTQALLDL